MLTQCGLAASLTTDPATWLCAANQQLLYLRNPGQTYSHQELQSRLRRQEQQRVQATYSPTRGAINALGQLPGMFHMAEASLRSTTEGPERRLGVALQAIGLMGHVQVSGAVTPQCMAACVSFTATVRKVRQLDLNEWYSSSGGGRATPGFEQVSAMQATVDVLLDALTDVNFWVVEEGDSARCLPGCSVSVGATPRMQVLALLSLAWADEQNAYVRMMCEQSAEQHIPDLQPPLHHHYDTCHTRLNALTMQSLLRKNGGRIGNILHRAAHRLQLATQWDAFARSYLNGRLSPGCCHLGCTNLAGISEAALPTQLCGGCKQVRYCSTKCQREAWVGGGHRQVCGRGE